MGYIKYFSGKLKNGHLYNGWIDAKAGEPVKDLDVKAKYEQSILEHTGIRLIEPELFDGYDPNKKGMMREVVLEHDMEPIDTSADEAAQFKRQNGDKVDVWEVDGSWKVRFLKGATLMVPKALRFDRLVAGQIPTGWSAERYGIPKEIINQVDPVTLYALVSTAEALIRSGITDPYEFYRYVHVSEVGNSSGSGVGGMKAYRLMYKDRFFDKDIQKDILQETFINTMAAWVNMLMLSSSGPIKPCVGACATAAISVEIAVDTIQSGKAKILLAGGYDDFHEEGSYEFANMKATSSSLEEFARGRTPREMSRPTTTTRAGFMEAQGSGSAVLMSASVAIEMGVPIYGIIALTNTATDKEGRSVPAPGQGILTSAREQSGKFPSPLLDINYRRRQLEQRRHAINQWVESEYEMLRAEVDSLKQTGSFESDEQEHEFIRERTEFIQKEATRQEKDAQDMWANEFWHRDPRIAPLRGALATYGLTINDIDIASFHGTSTKANDKNESSVINEQFKHLGRTPGNVCMAICQKYLTGHPKGAAAAWMLNGVIQSILSGIVPGNRNADNVSAELEKFEYILYPSRSIQTDGLKAGLLKSFGFGQVGAEILVIHPDYVLASLERAQYEDYARRVRERQAKAYRHYHNALTGQSPFIHVKTEAPYTEAQQNDVYLNPAARMIYDDAASKYKFKETNQHPSTATNADVEFTRRILESLTATDAKGGEGSGNRGVGVDVELVSSINVDNENFVERNFTPAEVQYCRAQPDPRASFAGKWCAKEAVVKAVSSLDTKAEKVWTQGAAAPLNEIEVMAGSSGAPEVVLHGSAKQAVAKTGVTDIKVSISHSGSYAVSVAIAK
ncbi:fatty acid synthase alpha subunit Lsd1 [Spiromyces aspiralis]|uniref:Fatty acid synthase alpha subunit Lsd1 n=1 Tax=Spiromyces aspiralis TaxID=68401 RepID=A0ACC1HVJ5_9FUNG|nr:fatty acid synthase alpha subunit Lsd1 [Spiromyces aspiralis]